ncbi:MAG: succinate dehydrogenase, hydrophobic membrane anchor protein [Acetobacteraceae bacterium]|nr:succinate dehydrogenase, hydrophobic membrane anchor protein [Acetobacteraceae bacterium]
MSTSTSNRAPAAGAPATINVRRSQLGRVRGAGSAQSGVHHWYVERATAIALVPLTIWFIISILRLVGSSQPAVAHWAGNPINAALLLALVAMTFHHMQLGLQVVLEDYVPDRKRLMSYVLLIKGAALLLGLIAAISVLKLALV